MKKIVFLTLALVLLPVFNAQAAVRLINYNQLVEIKKQMLTVVIIDSRPKKEQDGNTIPNARVMAVDEMTEQSLAAMVPSKSNPIVFYCTSAASNFSGDAANKASNWGYTNIFRYSGGIADWWVNSSKAAPAQPK